MEIQTLHSLRNRPLLAKQQSELCVYNMVLNSLLDNVTRCLILGIILGVILVSYYPQILTTTQDVVCDRSNYNNIIDTFRMSNK